MKATSTIDTATASVKDLVAWYNANSGAKNPIKKFRDEATARAKCAELQTALADLAKAKEAEKGKGEATPKGKSKALAAEKKGKTKGEKEEGGTQGRTSALAGKTITRAIDKETKKPIANPRREGTNGFKSFAVIKDGMTYEDYIAAGGRAVDLRWDMDHGYVTVK